VESYDGSLCMCAYCIIAIKLLKILLNSISAMKHLRARARVMFYKCGKFNTVLILQLGPVIFGETDQLITYLQSKNLIATNKTCLCGSAIQLSSRSDVSDGVRFRCPNCHKCTTIWDYSFFSKSRLPLQKSAILMYLWA
jgi:hypothetical protein